MALMFSVRSQPNSNERHGNSWNKKENCGTRITLSRSVADVCALLSIWYPIQIKQYLRD